MNERDDLTVYKPKEMFPAYFSPIMSHWCTSHQHKQQEVRVRDELMEGSSSDTGAVIDGAASIGEGRYQRTAAIITPTDTTHNGAAPTQDL